MKILFLPIIDMNKTLGSVSLTNALGNAISSAYGKENVDIMVVDSNIKWRCSNIFRQKKYNFLSKVCNMFIGYSIFWGHNDTVNLISILSKKHYDIVFFGKPDSGKLPKIIKKKFPNIRLINFVHDNYPQILSNYSTQKKKLSIKSKLYIKNLAKSEKTALDFSDLNFVFNSRERDSMIKWFGIEPDGLVPMFLEDRYNPMYVKPNHNELRILFVGAYLAVNIEGIIWFYKNVFQHLQIESKLTIVGSGMELLKTEIKDSRVEIYGKVNSLTEYYQNTDLVVGPIFSGTGMKTKTAEALMYKKIILGTKECFEGYESIPDFWRCNNEHDYLDKLLYYSSHDFTKEEALARQIYEEKYSEQAASIKLREVINGKSK